MIINTKNSGGIIYNVGGGLPKTGQQTIFQVGDDGYYKAGYNSATRFEEVAVSGGTVIKDFATGLMWPKFNDGTMPPVIAVASWSDAIVNAEALSFGGFSDWKLPNINELISLKDWLVGGVVSPFVWTASLILWTSTTMQIMTTLAWCFSFSSSGGFSTVTKTDLKRYAVCRSFLYDNIALPD